VLHPDAIGRKPGELARDEDEGLKPGMGKSRGFGEAGLFKPERVRYRAEAQVEHSSDPRRLNAHSAWVDLARLGPKAECADVLSGNKAIVVGEFAQVDERARRR
jgi:hypothetical protein